MEVLRSKHMFVGKPLSCQIDRSRTNSFSGILISLSAQVPNWNCFLGGSSGVSNLLPICLLDSEMRGQQFAMQHMMNSTWFRRRPHFSIESETPCRLPARWCNSRGLLASRELFEFGVQIFGFGLCSELEAQL